VNAIDQTITGGESGIVLYPHVGRQEAHATGQRPDMQVVYFLHTRERDHVLHDLRYIEVAGRGFHQDIHRLAAQSPRAARDQDGDADGNQRIGILPARQHDDEATYEELMQPQAPSGKEACLIRVLAEAPRLVLIQLLALMDLKAGELGGQLQLPSNAVSY
jgi:hypothetical protein